MKTQILPLGSIFAVGILAWLWLAQVGTGMARAMTMPDMAMGLGVLAFMWAVMMIAMMVPAAAPSFLLYARMSREGLNAAAYLAGYLGAWGAIGILYALSHWELQNLGLIGPGMRLSSAPAAGILLLAVGAWQWSPMKASCVSRCRSPLGFFMTDWREGPWGALLMGARYAGWCIGCCWMVMLVLFVAGAMSFVWAAVISLYVLAERVLPFGRQMDRLVGVGLMGWGIWLLGTTLLPLH